MAFFVPRPGLEGIISKHPIMRAKVVFVALQIANEARARVAVLSGATERSIRTEETAEGARVVAGSAARFLEFGARGHIDPFLRPAADAVVPGGRRGS